MAQYGQGGYPQPPYGQQYGQPYGQPPQQGNWNAPPQGQYPQPQAGYPPQGYPPQGGPAPGGYQPPQQQYGQYPPQQQYPQQGYQPPQGTPQPYPPQQGYAPPQQPYPQAGYAPPQGPPTGYAVPPPGYPPQQAYPQQPGPPGAYPQQNYPPPGPPAQEFPSPGYGQYPLGQPEAASEADGLRRAMKGFGTDEKMLIRILAKPDPIRMRNIRESYDRRHSRHLGGDIVSEVSGYFRETLLALIRGPLEQDVHSVFDAINGAGTKEDMMDDILLGRTNADLDAIKREYQRVHKRSLPKDVHEDLSTGVQRLYDMVMTAQRAPESAPVIPQQIDADVNELHRALNSGRTDDLTVSQIFSSRSNNQLRAINQAWLNKFKIPLENSITRHIHGHHQNALCLILHRALDRVMSDAEQLEAAMAGMGTKDLQLIQRVTRVHWDPGYLMAVKQAYHKRYGRDLIQRVKGETSGDYERTLVACLE